MEGTVEPDGKYLMKLANTKMPFGKYAGTYLVDLPEPYVVWFNQKKIAEGNIGRMLADIYEIKVNGLEKLLRPLIKNER